VARFFRHRVLIIAACRAAAQNAGAGGLGSPILLHGAAKKSPRDRAFRRVGGLAHIQPFRASWLAAREVGRVQVLVRDNNVDQALKALKKKMQREGIFREMKLRGHYEKPSEKKAREKAEAIRRARKLARKKMQREGLLPMKPKVIPGAGPGGAARGPRRPSF
jgi:small subunit ribosomal protein S21